MLSPSFALAFRSLFIISYSVAFVKHFFDFFFRSLPLSGGDSLFILPHLSAFVNTFFRGSDIFFSLPAALAVEPSPLGRFSHRCFSAFCRVFTGQLVYNTTLLSHCQHLFLKKFNFFCFSSFSAFYRLSNLPYLLSIHPPASSFSFSQSTFSPFLILEPVWFPVFLLSRFAFYFGRTSNIKAAFLLSLMSQ